MANTGTIDREAFPYGYIAKKSVSENNSILNFEQNVNFYQMFWVNSGEITLHLDSNTLSVGTNECAFIGKNQSFKIETQSEFEISLIQFDEVFYCRLPVDQNFLDHCTFFDTTFGIQKYVLPSVLEAILDKYFKSLGHIAQRPYNDLNYLLAHNTIERLLLFVLIELINKIPCSLASFANPDNNLAIQIKNLINKEAKKERSVNFYANQLDITVKKLTEICNEVYGVSPKKFIISQVIIEAKKMLQHSTMNIKEIAYSLHFEEPSNFIRFFIKATGISPTEYREHFTHKKLERQN